MIRAPRSNLLNNQIISAWMGFPWIFGFGDFFYIFGCHLEVGYVPPDQICSTIKSFQLGWAFIAAVSNTIPKSFSSSSSQFDFVIKHDISCNII